ncbi:MAG: 4,5-DOPA dioxygenase extradiol [Gammaproteobacteria bacterium]
MKNSDTRPMPAIFFGHGNPMNALEKNAHTQAWRHIGESLPRPRAILSISAHWYTRGVRVTAASRPHTIHDFVGFPPALFDVQYPASGDPDLAQEIASMLLPVKAALDSDWGFDHGTWSVLVHVFPRADIPVLQLSIDAAQPPAWHYALGQNLQPLRDTGVLVMGSGNIVHNLRQIRFGERDFAYDWAAGFDARVRNALTNQRHQALIEFIATPDDDARLSIPTPDHYLPLLYIAALQRPGESVDFPVADVVMGSISMTAVRISTGENSRR